MAKKRNGKRPLTSTTWGDQVANLLRHQQAPRVDEVNGEFVVHWSDPKPPSFVMPSVLFDDMIGTINRQRKALAAAQTVVSAITRVVPSSAATTEPAGQPASGTPTGA